MRVCRVGGATAVLCLAVAVSSARLISAASSSSGAAAAETQHRAPTSCTARTAKVSENTVINRTLPNCYCDANCLIYKDCCPGFLPRVTPFLSRNANVSSACVRLNHDFNYQLRAIHRCQAVVAHRAEFVADCEQPRVYPINDDGKSPAIAAKLVWHVVVYSTRTLLTYRNLFCALCNGEARGDVRHADVYRDGNGRVEQILPSAYRHVCFLGLISRCGMIEFESSDYSGYSDYSEYSDDSSSSMNYPTYTNYTRQQQTECEAVGSAHRFYHYFRGFIMQNEACCRCNVPPSQQRWCLTDLTDLQHNWFDRRQRHKSSGSHNLLNFRDWCLDVQLCHASVRPVGGEARHITRITNSRVNARGGGDGVFDLKTVRPPANSSASMSATSPSSFSTSHSSDAMKLAFEIAEILLCVLSFVSLVLLIVIYTHRARLLLYGNTAGKLILVIALCLIMVELHLLATSRIRNHIVTSSSTFSSSLSSSSLIRNSSVAIPTNTTTTITGTTASSIIRVRVGHRRFDSPLEISCYVLGVSLHFWFIAQFIWNFMFVAMLSANLLRKHHNSGCAGKGGRSPAVVAARARISSGGGGGVGVGKSGLIIMTDAKTTAVSSPRIELTRYATKFSILSPKSDEDDAATARQFFRFTNAASARPLSLNTTTPNTNTITTRSSSGGGSSNHSKHACAPDWRRILPTLLAGFVPAACLNASAVYLDVHWPHHALSPGFSSTTCWLRHAPGGLVFLVAPVSLLLLLTAALSLHLICRICRSIAERRTVRRGVIREAVLISVKLTLCMGLGWLINLLAILARSRALFEASMLINSAQGFFLALCFLTSQRVRTTYAQFWSSSSAAPTPAVPNNGGGGGGVYSPANRSPNYPNPAKQVTSSVGSECGNQKKTVFAVQS